MSRPGITYMEVAEAAEELISQGKNPTIEQVRHQLGTGSSTTISNHLREWKDRLSGVDVGTIKEKLPQDLMAIVKGLWEKVVDQSQEKIETLEVQTEKKISLLEQELHKYKTNNQRWQQLYHQWNKDKEVVVQEKALMEQVQADLTEKNHVLNIVNETLSRQINERDARISELRDVYEKSQSSLDKLRVDMRDQRQQFYELMTTQQKNMQVEINGLREESVALKEEYHDLKKDYSVLDDRYQMEQAAYAACKHDLMEMKNAERENKNSVELLKAHYIKQLELVNRKLVQENEIIRSESEDASS